MSHAAERTAIAEDMRRLRRLLERTLRSVDERSPGVALAAPEGREVSILDVACGRCDEAETLSSFFQSFRQDSGGRPLRTRLVGTDVREREIDDARDRFRSGEAGEFAFFAGDASRLGDHRQLEADFDVLFFRHQNLYHGRRLWHHVFEQGLARLKDDGLLIVTSYFDREHALALKAFESVGAAIVTTARNPESRPLATPGKSVDRHIAVLRKRNRG